MSRNKVKIQGEELIVTPIGLDKLWSLTTEIRVPLSLVRGATHDPGIVKEPKGVRAPGLNTLGKKVSATYRKNHERHFWNVTGAADVLVVEVDPTFKYSRLILSVDDPVGLEREINQVIRNGAS
ncbi:hypothetical protein SAMN05421878_1271 [Actinobaculum suis]|uniref:Uncharacterized protein n=1 Tax=Actinobaculum suis TaxID=1657 RepID=A0A0K9EUQ4_9ACTO|nr:hypothetical protein [Actinobaculum suis]KMY23615.1 hypothetical protein ACU19_02840 [Actinobaculum suis]MDY5154051.1 hypothetical protein [Actinobaculum suis]OCA96114.1 hypothetical protein ACU20_02665 [Actinobaculum suis]OCA96257.1 hypothetical protein ACU21_01885 [Actinobaculum suis]SDE68077.1 hypothetical protein SAMN05421878_1271 [Actinobaculum suis]